MSHVDSTSVPSEYANDPYKLAELLERQIDEIQALVAERKAMQDTLKEIQDLCKKNPGDTLISLIRKSGRLRFCSILF